MYTEELIRAEGLSKTFPLPGKKCIHALSQVDLQIMRGETLGLVGESGCGKSTLGRTLLQLYTPTEGAVYYEGQKISGLTPRQLMPYRRQMQLVFQDPYASLNPRMTVHDLIAEPLRTHKVCPTAQALTQRVCELLDAVGLPQDVLYRYPHQFSGGQRQRIGIARALALEPALLVCDEPVSALDVSVQNQILNLLKDLQSRLHLTLLFISHDLRVVRFMSDRVCVMFLGKICEIGPSDLIYNHPAHPYTQFLLDAIPKADPRQRFASRQILQGELPSPINPPSGCRFHTRCPYATEICRTQVPEMTMRDGRHVACHHPLG